MYRITENEFSKAMDNCMINSDMKQIINSTKQETFDQVLSNEMFRKKQEKKIRDDLKSRDGETGEIHDQVQYSAKYLVNNYLGMNFYRDHQLLLKLFLYLGVMPVVRSAPGIISFKWRSPQMAYALIVYCLTTALVLAVGYERLSIFQTTKKFDDFIYAIVFILFLMPHFWIPFVGWGVANQVATYKTMWAHFQVRFYRVAGVSLTFPRLRILIIILFVGCVSLAVVFLCSLSFLLDGFLLWHTIAYYHIITMINMNAALLYINARAVKEASHSLSACFKKDTNFDCNPRVVSEYRILWLNLSEILQALGNAYARTYTTFCLFLSINITIAAFGALSEIFDTGFSPKVMGMLILTIYCTTLLFIVCDCAEAATNAVAQEIQLTLMTMNLSKVEIQTRREINHFISAIELNPPVICMQGYGELNRQLLTSLFSKIAVYLIVLVQFKLSMVEQNKFISNVLANQSHKAT